MLVKEGRYIATYCANSRGGVILIGAVGGFWLKIIKNMRRGDDPLEVELAAGAKVLFIIVIKELLL